MGVRRPASGREEAFAACGLAEWAGAGGVGRTAKGAFKGGRQANCELWGRSKTPPPPQLAIDPQSAADLGLVA